MGGDVLGQTGKQHTEVGLPHFQGWIEGESSSRKLIKASKRKMILAMMPAEQFLLRRL
jgi:hypothetical protein